MKSSGRFAMENLYDVISLKSSKITTANYSTSFSMGIRVFHRRFQYPIYAIYGFVRFADEIVDTFHEYDKTKLLKKFREDTRMAIRDGISLNPILNSFQMVVNRYGIDHDLIDTFLNSMEMDIVMKEYTREEYDQYILGSAQVVGLMCLRVFCEGDEAAYGKLKESAMRLGSAYQKINFLRDMKTDFQKLGRTYFPGVDMKKFDNTVKKEIEREIESDFGAGLEGIRELPDGCRFGVYLSYVYYYALFKKISGISPDKLMKKRIRIPDFMKIIYLFTSFVRVRLNRLV